MCKTNEVYNIVCSDIIQCFYEAADFDPSCTYSAIYFEIEVPGCHH